MVKLRYQKDLQMSFEKIGLIRPILDAINELGYSEPTPIQERAIGLVLAKKDIFATAQTGTGKTAAFLLPIIQRLRDNKPLSPKAVRVVVMTPTRELAIQIKDEADKYAKYMELSISLLVGGKSLESQEKQLQNGVDILIATPGRLREHIINKSINLKSLEIFVIDEADRMLDMGFINDIKKILAILPKNRQNLLFSATFSDEIKRLADGLLNNPALIEVAKRNTTSQNVKQTIHPVDKERKKELLMHLINTKELKQVLVFTRTKHGANKLTGQLEKDGITAAAIHGNKSQNARTKALADFKNGEVRVLVATDIAARGIDIDQLPHVVNFELPNIAEDYVHRIGRTGRAGNGGEAISLVCVDEHEYLKGIEKLIKQEIPKHTFKEFTPDPFIKAEPIQQRGGSRNGNSRGNSNGQKRRTSSSARSR